MKIKLKTLSALLAASLALSACGSTPCCKCKRKRKRR